MKKSYSTLIGVMVINLIVMTVLFLRLPDTVPTNMGFDNTVQAMGSKYTFLMLPVIALAVPLFILGYRRISKTGATTANPKYDAVILYATSALLIIMCWFTYLIASSGAQLGDKINISVDLIFGVPFGIFCMIFGNFSARIKHNFYLGIRTPWTLMDPVIWSKTHRLGGYLAFAGGAVMVIFSIVGYLTSNSVYTFGGLMACVLLMALVPSIYSFILYIKMQRSKNS